VSSPVHSPISASRSTIGEARREKQIVKLGDVCSAPSKRFNLLKMPDDVLMEIVSFIVTPSAVDHAAFSVLQSTCRRMRALMNSPAVWNKVPVVSKCGRLNVDAFTIVKKKSQGTEGTCFQAFFRKEQRMVALKKARVYPDNEGVPYYMMRELSALQKLKHRNICALESANLHNYKLYLLFPYIEKTLHDFVNPGGGEEYLALPPAHIRCIMSQLLSAVSFCHERGIMHRNLKPKHLLIIPGPKIDDPLGELCSHSFYNILVLNFSYNRRMHCKVSRFRACSSVGSSTTAVHYRGILPYNSILSH
jgi:serine/threonine protein kinase